MTNVPEIRFKGFTDAWEQRRLGDVAEFKNGMNFAKEAMGHGFPFVNLQNIFGRTVVETDSLGLAESTEQQRHEYSLLNGDVLFVRSSVKPEGVGETALVPFNLPNTTYSGFIIRCRFSDGFADEFKQYVFGTKPIRTQIMNSATTSANTNINQDSLGKIELYYPEFEEQTRIGQFFRTLDNTIAIHKRKLEGLRELKKAYLQVLFPQAGEAVPRVRFEGFREPWCVKMLSDFIETSKAKNRQNQFSKQDVLSVSGEHGIVNQIQFQGRSFAGASVTEYGVVDTGDIVYTKSPLKSNPHGIIKTNSGAAGIVSTLYAVYKPLAITNPLFVQYYFEHDGRLNSYLKPLVNKGAKNDMKVSDNNALMGDVVFPCRKEQDIIVSFLKAVDERITSQFQRLGQFECLKTAYLQRMFI